MSQPNFTMEDLLRELDLPELLDGECWSVEQMAEKKKCSESVVRKKLKKLKKAGVLKSGYRMSTDIADRPHRTPVYTLTKGGDIDDV